MTPSILIAESWRFGINDPTIFAWIIFSIYFAVAWYCFTAREDSGKFRSTLILWKLLAVFLIFLGLNKQLDLHTLVFELLRERPAETKSGKIVNYIVVALAGIVGFAAIAWTSRLLSQSTTRVRLAYGTMIGILSLQILRFLPGPQSSWLVMHVFTDNENALLHVHAIEVLELVSLIGIGIMAWFSRPTPARTANTKSDPA